MFNDFTMKIIDIIIQAAGNDKDDNDINHSTKLSDMGFNNYMVNNLTKNLNHFIQSHPNKGLLHNNDIQSDMHVGDVINITREKLFE